jgi:predicted MFS family arabinose efflux permease
VTSAAATGVKAPRAPLGSLFKHRNVALGMLTLLCAMAGVFVISAMMPLYLIGNLKLGPQQMGFVFSAVGFGGFLGQLGMPALSDKLGRKTVVMVCFALAAVFLYLFSRTGADTTALFGLLFCGCLFNFGALAVIAGPLAAEAAPVGLIASVAGMIIGIGEIFGGGVAPSIAGFIAQNYGLQHTLTFALGAQVVGLIISLTLLETAPIKAGHVVSGIDKLEEELGGVAKG